ncbi:glyoxal oxidase N-terminus-domain-containing protein [Mycena pura]|uniref:Glyoxal oxidase N-terminus-domain-containing protein n=1 Tax=Mycena pura TaxID=153505 RepID=A0AAD6YCW1_9AGAR|nr:glyoxal oxidase N-terminus-domain-containing protein [Mycena pura]
MLLPLSLLAPPLSRAPKMLALFLALFLSPVHASESPAGTFADGGNTQVSAMMMFLGNSRKVYILDKAEGNAAQINGHPAWASVWDIDSHQVQLMDVSTNVFCASGMHLPNGSFVTFGGNGAIGPGGNIGSQKNPSGASGAWDSIYQDFDGSKSIRILNPCNDSDDFSSSACQWFDDPTVLSMQRQRWYSAAEPLANGTVVIIGGFVNGGYINRNYPNTDPMYEGGAAEPTYEFYPSNGQTPQIMNFMVKTSGLNAYAHTYLLASGNLFLQANYSTMIWNPDTNTETDLPDMPGQVVRVYPASGGVAMLPLTLANNYTQSILFCGGSDMPDASWGDYSFPAINTWNYPASRDCQRITPEPADGSAPAYVKDDEMLETRTMGQFIILPTGKLLMVNGGNNGTAGYATATGQTSSFSNMPFDMSLASGPVGTPAIYDPDAPAGSRWTNAGLSSSQIARLYHSSALLLPDASVLIAGSNPNVDVNTTAIFPTQYQAEIFYPPYFSATTRPVPTGIPSTISYGGSSFDVTISTTSYSGSANSAAANTTVVLLRPGWTTHAMNMGQRYLQLNNTYTVNNDSSITLHVSQAPPNANLFQPGPAMVFVVVNGVPSNGTAVIVGSGQIETQATAPVAVLPDSVSLASASGSADGSSTSTTGSVSPSASSSQSHRAAIIGGTVGALVLVGLVGAGAAVWFARRRRAMNAPVPTRPYQYSAAPGSGAGAGLGAMGALHQESPSTSAIAPLTMGGYRDVPSAGQERWGYEAPAMQPFAEAVSSNNSITGLSSQYDPYSAEVMSTTPAGQRRF